MNSKTALKRGCDLGSASSNGIQCVSCEKEVRARNEAQEAGWQLDPPVCPDCLRWTPLPVAPAMRASKRALRIDRRGRFWSVYDGDELICVTVYRKGARSVVDRLASK